MKLLKLVPDNTNLDFMRWRNVALVISTLLTVASIAFTVYRGLNLGVDFVGGQMIRADFAQPVHVEELRGRVDRLQLGEASIQELGSDQHLPDPPAQAAGRRRRRQRRRQPASGSDPAADYPGARVDAVEPVSGKVSEELADNSAHRHRASRCSGSPSTSGSGSNGSSASARC